MNDCEYSGLKEWEELEKSSYHRCQMMIAEEYFQTKRYSFLIRLIIKHIDTRWKLYSNDCFLVDVECCPYCHEKLFAKNNVTIE